MVDLSLRLHQCLVAQLQVGGNLPRTDHLVGNDVRSGAVGKREGQRTDAGLGRVGIVSGIRRQRSRRAVVESRSHARTDELNAARGEDIDFIVAAGDCPDVHQVRQVVDGGVALILQRRGSGIGRAQALKFRIDGGNLLQVGIGLRRRRADILVDVRAQRLDALRGAIELLSQCLRRTQCRRLRRQACRAGRDRL